MVQLESYRCAAEIADVCVLDTRIGEIADSFGFSLKEWVEDGLGRHEGIIVKFEDELVACLKESLEKPGSGVRVEVDGAILRRLGVEKIVCFILSGLGLSVDLVKWKTHVEKVS